MRETFEHPSFRNANSASLDPESNCLSRNSNGLERNSNCWEPKSMRWQANSSITNLYSICWASNSIVPEPESTGLCAERYRPGCNRKALERNTNRLITNSNCRSRVSGALEMYRPGLELVSKALEENSRALKPKRGVKFACGRVLHRKRTVCQVKRDPGECFCSAVKLFSAVQCVCWSPLVE